MPYVIYASASGRYVGASDTLSPTLAADGMASTFYEVMPDLTKNVWDATQRMFVTKAAPVRTTIALASFLTRLGPAFDELEYATVERATDVLVAVQRAKAVLRAATRRIMARPLIDTTDPVVIAFVDALVTAAILTPAQRTTVLAPAGATE